VGAEERLRQLLHDQSRGVLITLKGDGRPQSSNIIYAADGDRIRISVTADRAKTRNLQRDPRANLHVSAPDFWAYVVAECTASVGVPAGSPDDDTVEALIQLYRDLSGEHPDWDDYRRAMVAEHRLVLTLHVERLYGVAPRS
jgi:PPOX class probable F420-dependent enzyme